MLMRFFSRKKEEPPAVQATLLGQQMEILHSSRQENVATPYGSVNLCSTPSREITATIDTNGTSRISFRFLGYDVYANYGKSDVLERIQIDIHFSGHIFAELDAAGKLKVSNGMKNPPVNSAYSGEVQVPGWPDERANKLADVAWKKSKVFEEYLRKLREDPVVKAALKKVA